MNVLNVKRSRGVAKDVSVVEIAVEARGRMDRSADIHDRLSAGLDCREERKLLQ